MAKFTAAAKKFVQGEEGATMVEYALMVALIAVAAIVTVKALSTSINNTFDFVGGELDAVSGA